MELGFDDGDRRWAKPCRSGATKEPDLSIFMVLKLNLLEDLLVFTGGRRRIEVVDVRLVVLTG